MDPVFQNNVILTQTERLTMSSRPQEPQVCPKQKCAGYRRQRLRQDPLLVEADLMQMHSSYVVTDPKGTILVSAARCSSAAAPKLAQGRQAGEGQERKVIYEPYQIKVLNTIQLQEVHAL